MFEQQKKTVVVLGATGQQGGSVVETLLQQPNEYAIRGLTRNVDSEKAQSLAAKGVEVFSADLNDPASLSRAFQGAHVIYAMTDFWASMSFDVEYGQGKAIADIAADLPHLEHFIWASLPDAKAISKGQYANVFHWQSKAAVTDYIRQTKPHLWSKTTEILFPNYFENTKTQPESYLPVKQHDGVYVRSFVLKADTLLPNVAISDTGKLVRHVIQNGSEFFEKRVAFYSEAISEGEKLEILGDCKLVPIDDVSDLELTGLRKDHKIPVRYEQISAEMFREHLETKMPPITALDFTEQLLIFDDWGMIYGRPEFVQANQIPGLQLKTWKEYVESADLLSSMKSVL